MNKGLFRLIFNQQLNMLVPAPETALAGVARASASPARRLRRALAALFALAVAQSALAAPLAGLVPGGGSWVGANPLQASGSVATITQTIPKAILNWQQLNLNRGEILNFNQANSSWSALNRIHDANPSTISGNINALGHIYLINSNGIVFGNGAQINVGSLTASTLDVTDTLFSNGILSDPTRAVFSGTGGLIQVEQGATLTAETGGRVMLLAKDVTNNGLINTPDGQTILAAGEQVYLKDSIDPAGLLVEVNSGGTATNLGNIIAQRGNVTLVGLAVNQEGRISASTSVRANGSIHLLARDTVDTSVLAAGTLRAQRGGVVTLGKDSTTTIDVETGDTEETLDAQLLNPSRVILSGGVIDVEGSIVAHGGLVEATAAFNPGVLPTSSSNSILPEPGSVVAVAATRIYLGEEASIDVSGVDASAPMSRNQLAIQLFSDQLKDTPLLRGGPLFGQTVYVDARKGTDLFDIQPALALKGKTIAERLSTGGTVSLTASSGDVLLNKGATIDVSGGVINYAAGYIRESSLLNQGNVVAISNADRNTPYQGLTDVYTVTDPKWGITRSWSLTPNAQGSYYQAYSEGRAAGTLNITAVNALQLANLKATTRPDITQRQTLPAGGTFNFAVNSLAPLRILAENNSALPSGFTVVGGLDETIGRFAAGDALSTALQNEIILDNKLFGSGFTNINLTGTHVVVDTAIKAAPTSSLTITARDQTDINANITAAGGNVAINGLNTHIADGVVISTAGLFTNDTAGSPGALTAPIAFNGGSVSVGGVTSNGTGLTLGDGVLIDASAGAWLDARGRLSGGNGGNVSLSGISELQPGKVQSYGFGKGGELSLTTLSDVQVGGQNPANQNPADTLHLDESFFSQGGFSKYTVNATRLGADVSIGDDNAAPTVISPQAQTLVARTGFGALASGSAIADLASPTLRAPSLRNPASVAFITNRNLTVAKNTLIQLDAPSVSSTPGSISLQAGGQLTILGSLIAPAGNISATISGSIRDFNFDNTQSLFVGDSARLIASGYYAVPPTPDNSLTNARVFNGGNITLNGAERGAVITRAGSLLDVSGVTGVVDVASADGTIRQTQYGSAGGITVSSRNALLLDGDLRGNASGTGAGGTLNVALTGSPSDAGNLPHPSAARTLTVTQNTINRATGLNPGDILDSVIGTGAISAEQIAAGGFDRATLSSNFRVEGSKIALASGLDLRLPTALTLDAATLEVTGNGTAHLQSAYAALANTSSAPTSTAVAGNGIFKLDADFIDLINRVTVTGVGHTQLSARQDIRGRSSQVAVRGSLTTPGELDLIARQIYPVTNSAFDFTASGAGSKINVQPNGQTPRPVLSAGGSLTLTADEIVQAGALRAPLGQITLNAQNQLTLADGSLTSVSADGLSIPYGLTGLGGLSLFAPAGQLTASTSDGITSPPEKKINLNSTNVDLRGGARIDLSGGGDVFAYEFINGIGGTQDVLGQAGVYAVIPDMQGEYAPFDYSYNRVVNTINPTGTLPSDLKSGEAIYLSGVPGLPAGTYTLLPGRYALLPGAFMVQASNSKLALGQSVAQLDGSALVSGYRTVLDGSSRDTQDSSFRVTSGSVFRPAAGTISRAPAEYLLTSGNQFFTNLAQDTGLSVPRLAADAGQLTLNAGGNLTLAADILTNKAAGARGALVDIISDKISVVSDIGAADGTLQLTADALSALNADSLLLGGVRSQTADGTLITTNASSVTFANDANHALQVTELIAAATDSLTLNSGATIKTLTTTQPGQGSNLHASGDGALLAVSNHDINYDRTGVSGMLGTLDIRSGASIQAQGALVVDATLNTNLNGDINVANGGAATLGGNGILLGDTGNVLPGLRVDNNLLASLGNLGKITLNSYKNLDIYGPVDFGNRDSDLTVNAAGIAGHLGVTQSSEVVANLTARNFVLQNTTGAAFEATSTAAGSSLNIDADSIAFNGNNPNISNPANAGNTVIAGFANNNFSTSGEVIFSGVGQTQLQTGLATISSARITAATGTNFSLEASGSLSTSQIATPNSLPAASGLGAKLNITAASLDLGSEVDLASGQLNARATQGDLNITTGAVIKVASVPVQFDRLTSYTPAGQVSLQSDLGNVTVQSGSEIDVSGAGTTANGSNAGTVRISAVQGAADVQGVLKGQAASGHQSGSFALDSLTLPAFSTLNNALNAGGFTESREFRVRSGNLQVATTDTLTANQLSLSVDAGTLTVAGALDASAAKGGNIGLYAGNGVTLTSTANLNAASTGVDAEGGTVEVATLAGNLDLQAGSEIDVSGDSGAKGGTVLLRAPRNAANTDINISELASTITGASTVRAEGFRTYTVAGNNITTANTNPAISNPLYSEAQSFLVSALTNATSGISRLGQTGNAAFSIVPGVEIRNTAGDLTLANDWTLYNWRFDPVTGLGITNTSQLSSGLNANGQQLLAGDLTLRAAGNLALNGTLNDGFSTATLTTANTAQGLAAWSYNLVGGADFSAANFLSTTKAPSTTTGNVTLASNKGIRTGRGDIRIAAGGNLTLGNNASVIYSAGRRADALAGFNNPANALYLTDGGDVKIRTQGNIIGALGASNTQQLPNNWLFREGGGTQNRDLTWWVRPDLFRAGVATFGGGDVTIQADGNISNLSAAAATTARYDSNGTGNFRVDGGGDLKVSATGDISNGVYHVGRGDANLQAGGSIRKLPNGANNQPFGTLLSLQNASAEVSAAGSAFIESVFNPTLFAQATANSATPLGQNGQNGSSPFFSTYGEDSSFHLRALTGDATLGLANTVNITARISGLNSSVTATAPALEIHPGTVAATAFSGNINVGRLVLAPAALGNLSLLAAGNVSNLNNGLIAVSDADPSLLPSLANPLAGSDNASSILRQFRTAHAATPLHAGDEQPISIVARDGSISLIGDISPSISRGPGLTSPKAVFIQAGQDITLNADIQHLNSADISVIKAGRDYIAPLDASTQVRLGGPGELLIEAGRNASLGSSLGISTVANTVNAALPSGGASITILAGRGQQGADLTDYIANYINPTGSGPAVLQGDAAGLAQYRQQTATALTAYIRELTDDNTVADGAALSRYLALDADHQAVFAYRHFSSELLASGKDFAQSGSKRGDNAIASLFPATRQYKGDLSLFNSQLRTLRDGSIDILTPGGLINAGVPTSSGNNIGIITERGGDIRAFAETGFQVEQSKVITQFGSDITVWTNNGDIDAGRGSKTALSVPDRVVSTDQDGNTTIDIRGSAAGSGIRAQTYDPDGPAGTLQAPPLGSVALIAPRGILNAGEAGIAAGDFLAVAQQVLGAGNIQVSGASSGVPLADTGSLAGSLAGVSGAASAATKSATEDVASQIRPAPTLNLKDFLPALVSVEVIGLGDQ